METDKNNLEEYKKNEENRKDLLQKVNNEILQTEKDYLNDLKILLTILPNPNSEELNEKEREVAKIIESSISEYKDFHKKIEALIALSTSFVSIGENRTIDGVFLENKVSLTSTYSAYIKDYVFMLEKLPKIQRESLVVKDFFSNKQREELSKGLDVMSFMIKPVQRITKYPLLFKEKLRHSRIKDDGDIKSEIEEVLSMVQEVAANVNETLNPINIDKLLKSAIEKTKQNIIMAQTFSKGEGDSNLKMHNEILEILLNLEEKKLDGYFVEDICKSLTEKCDGGVEDFLTRKNLAIQEVDDAIEEIKEESEKDKKNKSYYDSKINRLEEIRFEINQNYYKEELDKIKKAVLNNQPYLRSPDLAADAFRLQKSEINNLKKNNKSKLMAQVQKNIDGLEEQLGQKNNVFNKEIIARYLVELRNIKRDIGKLNLTNDKIREDFFNKGELLTEASRKLLEFLGKNNEFIDGINADIRNLRELQRKNQQNSANNEFIAEKIKELEEIVVRVKNQKPDEKTEKKTPRDVSAELTEETNKFVQNKAKAIKVIDEKINELTDMVKNGAEFNKRLIDECIKNLRTIRSDLSDKRRDMEGFFKQKENDAEKLVEKTKDIIDLKESSIEYVKGIRDDLVLKKSSEKPFNHAVLDEVIKDLDKNIDIIKKQTTNENDFFHKIKLISFRLEQDVIEFIESKNKALENVSSSIEVLSSKIDNKDNLANQNYLKGTLKKMEAIMEDIKKEERQKDTIGLSEKENNKITKNILDRKVKEVESLMNSYNNFIEQKNGCVENISKIIDKMNKLYDNEQSESTKKYYFSSIQDLRKMKSAVENSKETQTRTFGKMLLDAQVLEKRVNENIKLKNKWIDDARGKIQALNDDVKNLSSSSVSTLDEKKVSKKKNKNSYSDMQQSIVFEWEPAFKEAEKKEQEKIKKEIRSKKEEVKLTQKTILYLEKMNPGEVPVIIEKRDPAKQQKKSKSMLELSNKSPSVGAPMLITYRAKSWLGLNESNDNNSENNKKNNSKRRQKK